MGNELGQHLDQSKKTGVLTLRNFKLVKVPPEVYAITQFLRNIDLSINKLASIPPELFINTKSLKTLNLSQNRLGKFLIFHIFLNYLFFNFNY